jgi:hypothetical protein
MLMMKAAVVLSGGVAQNDELTVHPDYQNRVNLRAAGARAQRSVAPGWVATAGEQELLDAVCAAMR